MRPIMYDADLAVRMLNKIGKELVGAMSTDDKKTQRELLQKALNDHGFLYDILHLGDLSEIQMIDINPNNKTN